MQRPASLKDQICLDREKLEQASDAVGIALRLIAQGEATYRETDESNRRRLNQVFFERIYVSGGEVRAFDYREPFLTILSGIAKADRQSRLVPAPEGVARFEQRPFW